MNPLKSKPLIESDRFPFEFVSQLAEKESWRKEIHRPIYHVHKWWAKRLGSVFRSILLGCVCTEEADLSQEFYRRHSFAGRSVLDPFMGSGTTVGEAHKLGFTAFGRDINPVAVQAVRVAMGPVDRSSLVRAFEKLSSDVGEEIRALYRSEDRNGVPCEVLYFFWVMQAHCPACREMVELFPSWIIARNAYPNQKPEVRLLCPGCGEVFSGLHGAEEASCPACKYRFCPDQGTSAGAKARCRGCGAQFRVLDALAGERPAFRLYAKLVLKRDGQKEYLLATPEDLERYTTCSDRLRRELDEHSIILPSLALKDGYNTRQAMSYGFTTWRDFFNDRQLLALGLLQRSIRTIEDPPARDALQTLFSGVLEFNNMFASYKGEGTGAVRHMFSHHILKPERTPIEANLWGTPKSSGSFTNLFRSRLLRVMDYREAPVEVNGEKSGSGRVCSPPFSGIVESDWLPHPAMKPRGIYLSHGDSSQTGLPEKAIDYVVTDPPFFDNVHYSELADFFYAWQQLCSGTNPVSTRCDTEVQDVDPRRFSQKLESVLRECHRVLKDDGLFVFTYHHSKDEGWESLAQALLGAGFHVSNAHPVKSEMSVATPKSQTKQPIQLDVIFVCRKSGDSAEVPSYHQALTSAIEKSKRLRSHGIHLSKNDFKVILCGQLLTTIKIKDDISHISDKIKLGMDNIKKEMGIHVIDDGQGSKSWLEWGGGANVPADPTLFSDVALGD